MYWMSFHKQFGKLWYDGIGYSGPFEIADKDGIAVYMNQEDTKLGIFQNSKCNNDVVIKVACEDFVESWYERRNSNGQHDFMGRFSWSYRQSLVIRCI